MLFATELAQSRAVSTIRCYLAAVRHMHIMEGLPNPLEGKLRLDLVMKGIQRRNPRRKDTRLPITPVILRALRRELAKTPEMESRMMWAAICMAFFGFLRTGEFTVSDPAQVPRVLAVSDVSVDSWENPKLVTLHLRSSKTDQYGEGVNICLARNHSDLCPVAAVLSYLAVRPPGPGPLLRTLDGADLKKATFIENLHRALVGAGINPSRYKGHSFRIGATTTAAAAGIPDSTIQMLGRWSSQAFRSYIRTPAKDLASIATQLSGSMS